MPQPYARILGDKIGTVPARQPLAGARPKGLPSHSKAHYVRQEWSEERGSNPQPPVWKTGAPPIELSSPNLELNLTNYIGRTNNKQSPPWPFIVPR